MTARGELAAAGISDPALAAGYRLCRRLNAQHGKTFFLATLLLPPAKRPYVHALYGFARHTDDMVDEHSDPQRFTAWSDGFRADLEEGTSTDPVRRAVLHTIAQWQLPSGYFTDFLDVMRADLIVTRYPTHDALTKYMWGSAAVVGLQMLPILGRVSQSVTWEELEPHAVDLGYAFQLTNFVRDVGEDLRRGRVYLPQESLDAHAVTVERLQRATATGAVDEPIRNLLAAEIERTRALYRSAAQGVELVHPTSRDCLHTALTLYSAILDEIEARDYDVFSGRVAVGLGRRATVGLSGLRHARRARRWHHPTDAPTTPRATT